LFYDWDRIGSDSLLGIAEFDPTVLFLKEGGSAGEYYAALKLEGNKSKKGIVLAKFIFQRFQFSKALGYTNKIYFGRYRKRFT
jgi:hypothetical protein